MLSKKQRGSNNKNRARTKLSRAYERLANVKRDFIEKLTHMLCKTNELITLENLNIKDLQTKGNRHRRRKMAINSFGVFKTRLLQKAERFTTAVILADRYFPSTKACSGCGNLQDIALSMRTYTCPCCGLEIGRDHNAALNLLAYARKSVNRLSA